MEFLSGSKRITLQTKPSLNHDSKNHIDAIRSIKKKDCLIVPSDKSKRLVALDHANYEEMKKKALNPADKLQKYILPTSHQIKFNNALQNILAYYPNSSSVYIMLNKCKTSDPLPSHPYILPKDHKPGELEGSPIISSVNWSTRKLSQLIAKIHVFFDKHNVYKYIEAQISKKLSVS